MNLWQEYRKPKSINEAIEDLLFAPSPAIPIAGGTDLLLEINRGHHPPPHTLVDLTEVVEMNVVEVRGDQLYIGAAVPINRLISNTLLRKHALALIEACNLIAGPQVRNIATLGGNIAHALPAADGTIALMALDATAEIANKEGLHHIPLSKLFSGPGKSSIDRSSTIITGFYIPLCEIDKSSSFKRIMRPQGVALPILNCAIWIYRDTEYIKKTRISIGPGGPVPFRALQTEKFLQQKPFNEESLEAAVSILLKEAQFRTSPRRATSIYRRHIVVGLFKSTMRIAWQRAESR
jgi:carbon-monoxide dehydrogenase medium subunit